MEDKLSSAQLAEIFKCSQVTVNKVLKRFGILAPVLENKKPIKKSNANKEQSKKNNKKKKKKENFLSIILNRTFPSIKLISCFNQALFTT